MAEGERQLVEVDGRRLRLTNLDKVMYPETGMTKGEVIAYYAEIAPVMVPLVAGRPVTRLRWVHGVGTADAPEKPFFEKTLDEHAPEWLRRGVIRHSDGDKPYPIAGDRASLVWLAQQASLEVHVPQWRFAPDGQPANPDRIVFDLDPGEGVGLAECAEVARLVRALVAGMGLEATPVTSGSKGIHLYAPLDGRQTSEQVSEVARELARALEADHPGLIVSSMSKIVRSGRVLIDWSQNNGRKTTIAPYSLRGRPRPTVAAPRTWEELDDPGLRHLEAHEVLERVASGIDPTAALADSGAAGATAGSGPLATYLSMRTSGSTPEPMPASAWGASGGGAVVGATRFVIGEHHARRLHFDLRLERDGVLKSWAVPKGVPDDTGVNHLAVQTEDHPMEYLDFEGTIPAGQYGAGSMTVWDTGTYTAEKWRDAEVIFTLTGRPGGPLGTVRLALIRTSGEGEKSQWLLHRMKDQRSATDAAPVPSTSEGGGGGFAAADGPPAASAIPTGGHVEASAGVVEPITVRPMLASPGTLGLVSTGEWALEYKWDGIRVLARTDGGGLRMVSRNGNDVTARYPELAGLPSALRGDALVDGELVALDDDGRPSFELLQSRMNLTRAREVQRLATTAPVRLLLFDVLEIAGDDVTEAPYHERRRRLERLVRPGSGVPVEVPALAAGSAADALAEARRLGLEGLVAKHPDSAYDPGSRSEQWLKLKLTRTQEVVIGGYRRGVGSRTGRIRSLLVGIPGSSGVEHGLEYAGRVGSGLRELESERLLSRLDEAVRATSPFVAVPEADAADAVWVEPLLVGEIELAEWTSTGVARHPRWRGLRADKSPGEVVREV
ncbi:ATP-dependent DNA ligase LigD ligase module /ATP-dependent DNA ligase LigD phosphoesterase module /ATP-dependent DNA ligase LigD polymerase module [Agromyces sp. CF514]|uniref:ATP-dependent DNA ligase n=1 Tax=Agromyces sp. CF514 TaxID=1881031 RepID=UPI0008E426D7|nr:ATP-dependent DNA ligase [Agromyces sp. CF514]SFR68750.1 ATP-dependent DNA ligase LigD ligase module /ATP-dependent DNA ligase LigD phosphoesterase module /ATP-dependent DNA ligase LigD polymerase module [Agromyces sp. CF514]